jgi:hypothetical protein
VDTSQDVQAAAVFLGRVIRYFLVNQPDDLRRALFHCGALKFQASDFIAAKILWRL